MPLILGANSVSGYTVKNSLRFNSGSTDYLNRTFGTATNRKIFTLSVWLKRSKLGVAQIIFGNGTGTNTDGFGLIDITSGDLFRFTNTPDYATDNLQLVTTQVFRDTSAWYHLMVVMDTTQATSTNRVKIYVNGSQVTAFSTSIYPSLNLEPNITLNNSHMIGRRVNTSEHYLDGYLSEYYFIDGQALTPSSFGETDEDTGIWKPKAYTGTYGTNGFYLDFEDSANLGNDMSGNNNDFTVNNLTSIDQTTDTPTNNFCTGNPLFKHNNTPTFSNGNLTIVTATSDSTVVGNFGVTTGKWYFETKVVTMNGSIIGILGDIENIQNTGNNSGYYSQAFAYYYDGRKINNNTYSSYGNSYTSGDIIGVAFDLTNGKIWFAKNGTWQNSGDPVAGTNAAFTSLSSTVTYFPAFGDASSVSTSTFDCNFGNPPYSANSYADANGFGNFSYSVPSGYYALCTKNLYQYGF